ncbi:MAG TPA: ATP-binding cassette domain-containing protein [Pyrinomonadaceae bacterium]|jgi:ABC-type branched-subunit amino acid transport system ATPase component
MPLQLQDVTFTFAGKRHLLQNVSLVLKPQKIYALMGANGSGKTTLFNLVTGFIKPQSGEIFYREQNITWRPPYKINRAGISRTFQDLRTITKLTVKENIILAMQNNPTDNWLKALLPSEFNRSANAELARRADEVIGQFFLDNVKESPAGEISYGQQKLLTLACCLANGASLLLLDEPVAGIQPEYRNKTAALVKQLKEQGKTIFLIEHNTDFIADVADTIFFLREGKLSSFENIESLRADSEVMAAYT